MLARITLLALLAVAPAAEGAEINAKNIEQACGALQSPQCMSYVWGLRRELEAEQQLLRDARTAPDRTQAEQYRVRAKEHRQAADEWLGRIKEDFPEAWAAR